MTVLNKVTVKQVSLYIANGSQVYKEVMREKPAWDAASRPHRHGAYYKVGPNQGQTPKGDTTDEM